MGTLTSKNSRNYLLDIGWHYAAKKPKIYCFTQENYQKLVGYFWCCFWEEFQNLKNKIWNLQILENGNSKKCKNSKMGTFLSQFPFSRAYFKAQPK